MAEPATGPLVVEFAVGVPPARAFEVWTRRYATWWPPSHTVSGDPAAVVFEPRPGGRIYERARDGTEHAWGEVVTWEPPALLRFRWHLFFDPAEATDVEVRFDPTAGGTRVRLVQTGWDRLGGAGPPRRERTGAAWAAVTALFVAAGAAERGDRDHRDGDAGIR
jgi:uncharacterized protein YndB with AHSA1/START domain